MKAIFRKTIELIGLVIMAIAFILFIIAEKLENKQ